MMHRLRLITICIVAAAAAGLGWVARLHRRIGWTDGCIAVANGEMDEIWPAVPDGTPIDIRP